MDTRPTPVIARYLRTPDAAVHLGLVEYGEMLASMSRIFIDLRGDPGHPTLDPDPAKGYAAGNAVAAGARAEGHNGIIYPSVRHEGGTCIAALSGSSHIHP